MPVAVKTAPYQLTAILEKTRSGIVAFCPELDIATEGRSELAALSGLVELAKEYAKEYSESWDLYAKSPNRAVHRPYIESILAQKNTAGIKNLFSGGTTLSA